MTITTKRMNWLPRPSMWDEMQSWRDRRQVAAQFYNAAHDANASALTAALNDKGAGMVQITLQRANDRIQAEVNRRFAGLNLQV